MGSLPMRKSLDFLSIRSLHVISLSYISVLKQRINYASQILSCIDKLIVIERKE